jgi:hypothetical protein
MLDWLSTVFQSLSTVWRKLDANCNGGEAGFAKHCKAILVMRVFRKAIEHGFEVQ